MIRLLRGLGPAMPRPATADSLRAALGTGLALLLTGLLLAHLPGGPSSGLIAPLGASAFLIFVVPNSPLAQPWSVVVGCTVSALVALAVLMLLPASLGLPAVIPAGLAVALAILAMYLTRAMHPPGGAVALLIALSAEPAPSLLYALSPVADGAALLVLAGLIWNRLTGRVYPFRQPAAAVPHVSTAPVAPPAHEPRLGLDATELQDILSRLRLAANLGPEDLGRALEAAEAEAAAHHPGGAGPKETS